MAGMTSIYVGVSGLQSAQTALNTTTHNLANVYTKDIRDSYPLQVTEHIIISEKVQQAVCRLV